MFLTLLVLQHVFDVAHAATGVVVAVRAATGFVAIARVATVVTSHVLRFNVARAAACFYVARTGAACAAIF